MGARTPPSLDCRGPGSPRAAPGPPPHRHQQRRLRTRPSRRTGPARSRPRRLRLRLPARIDHKLIDDLATLRFIDENRPVLFLGRPGCGKTHLAVALAILVVESGYRGYFTTAQDMCEQLVAAKIDGTWTSKLKTYTAPTVLVIDDVGLLPMPDRRAASAFFEVVDTRYEKGHPTIVTTNRGLPDWAEVFGDSVVAAAILDRLMHTPSSSTSADPAGASANTTASRSPPPTTDSLTHRQATP